MAEPSREKTGSARELVRKWLHLNVVQEAFRNSRPAFCNQCGQAIQPNSVSTVYYRIKDRPLIHRRFCSETCGIKYEIETAVLAGFIQAEEAERPETQTAQPDKAVKQPTTKAVKPTPAARPSASPIRTSEIARLVDQLRGLGFQVKRQGDEIVLTGRIRQSSPP